MSAEKPFGPTQRKLREARKKGKVLKAQLLTAAITTGVVFALLSLSSERGLLGFRLLIESLYLEGLNSPLTCCFRAAAFGLLVSLTLLVPSAIAGWVSELLQGGFYWNPTPKFLNPSDGVVRVFSGLKSSFGIAFKATVICSLLFWFLSDAALYLVGMFAYASRPEVLAAHKFQEFTSLGASLILVFGIFDYLIARRRFLRELSMSHQELRDEYREEEGDPALKGARASLHRALALEEVVQRVRRAKVLIVERG